MSPLRLLAPALLAGTTPLGAQAPAVATVTASDAATARDPEKAFAQLKRLVGSWRNADAPESKLRVHFYLTAGGSVLVEDWRRGDAPHSLTLYHRDGPALLATHYCPQGNQPRLQLTGVADGPRLTFAFRDATDLDPTESHQHALSFDLTDPELVVRAETYRGPDGDEPDTLALVRG